jgi:hypothetical protein
MTARRVAPFVAGLAVLAALPLLVPRRPRSDPCSCSDPATSGHLVEVAVSGAGVRRFEGVECAARWLETSGARPKRIFVTDEVGRVRLDATDAWFVESPVVAVAATDDHVHVFARREDAERHADAYRGRVLVEGERPFAPYLEGRP